MWNSCRSTSKACPCNPKHPNTTKPCGSWLASDGISTSNIIFADTPPSLASQLPQVMRLT
ncbi:hypothetical protein EJA70_22090 [Pseudomonas sp. PB103]|nr:hypothetical protein EJA70_22090 [Pseudomonas sp. PB103]